MIFDYYIWFYNRFISLLINSLNFDYKSYDWEYEDNSKDRSFFNRDILRFLWMNRRRYERLFEFIR